MAKKRHSSVANKVLLVVLALGAILVTYGWHVYIQDSQERSLPTGDKVAAQEEALDSSAVNNEQKLSEKEQKSVIDQNIEELNEQIEGKIKAEGDSNQAERPQDLELIITTPPLDLSTLELNLRLIINNLNKNESTGECFLVVVSTDIAPLVEESTRIQQSGETLFCKFNAVDLSSLEPPSAQSPWQISFGVKDLVTREKNVLSLEDFNDQ